MTDSVDKLPELLTRIELLEKSNKLLRRSVTIIAFLPLFFMVFLNFNSTFSGRWVAVHNKQDKIKGWLDDTGLKLYDEQNIVRSEFTFNSIKFYDERHILLSEINGAGLNFYDSSGISRISLKAPTTSVPSASFQFYNKNGNLSGELFLDSDGLSHLLIWDKNKKQTGFPSEFKFD